MATGRKTIRKPATRERTGQEELIQELSGTSFFSTFSHDEIALLLFCSQRLTAAKDEMIFCEGDVGNQFYAIRSGKVNIRKEHSGRILATLGPGEVFGEIAVLDNHPRSASAIAASVT